MTKLNWADFLFSEEGFSGNATVYNFFGRFWNLEFFFMLDRYKVIVSESASLNSSLNKTSDKISDDENDSISHSDFYSTFMANYREINKITLSKVKESDKSSMINRSNLQSSLIDKSYTETSKIGKPSTRKAKVEVPHVQFPKKKKRRIIRDFLSFDPVFDKYFYNNDKISSEEYDYDYEYDDEKSAIIESTQNIDRNGEKSDNIIDYSEEEDDYSNINNKRKIKSYKKAEILHPKVSSPVTLKSLKKELKK
ncbi:hypothetical protein TRFO_21406 [Tritrichomonas foetus]|uniref:Uncharacterized protein n=1 Tax=Tritrichomonas foetus TaxID=1144522 RepID=A0A1J4KIF3_9EUKA|nr:hypothetical protein TRFO_21406 [Tritrichomonas foetus]|eukprot:OHT09612.1 hypothetical protein TRFO_21406 [Tritrichomonas foetus]